MDEALREKVETALPQYFSEGAPVGRPMTLRGGLRGLLEPLIAEIELLQTRVAELERRER